MELVGALFTKAVAGIGSAASAVGGAATSGGLFSLQNIATTFGVVAQIGGGVAGLAQGRADAAQSAFDSRQEFVTAKETSAALKAELAKTVSDQAVLFASGGVNLGSVSVKQARQQAVRDAEYELDIASSGALARSLAHRRAARNARARGNAALIQGVVGATQTLADAQLDRKEIG
ncbi:hypothetical protein [Oricola sp.]|uniref:hypothetical protein n=1 Tax=Oricola sp. TaxID=1979950 RepID=UPI0025D738B3|nr:hypothetical protein [Oricola sp.]MCI5075644.1 hypothetical protein [Oricola sp.]